jgi:hypothetical protein
VEHGDQPALLLSLQLQLDSGQPMGAGKAAVSDLWWQSFIIPAARNIKGMGIQHTVVYIYTIFAVTGSPPR